MAAKKKNGLSREQAAELYKDLQRSMAKMLKNEAEYYQAKGMEVPDSKKAMAAVTGASKGGAKQVASPAKAEAAYRSAGRFRPILGGGAYNRGSTAAITVVVVFALAKILTSALEFSGIASVTKAEASYVPAQPIVMPGPQFSKEELQVLTALDSRRAELEERSKRLDEREHDIQKRDKEFAVRITQLRELSDRLSSERERSDRKKDTQLDQLSNVYSSMNPQEAAKLMEQLDIVTSMSLIERMPEKRIGQILSAMTPERALEITKMLSGKVMR